MAELDFLIRKAIKIGLNYFSLSPNHSNPKDGAWIAAYRTTETPNMTYCSDDDPVEAVIKALNYGERDIKRLRAQKEADAPYIAATAKLHKRNAANAAERKAEEEAKAAALARRRRRDADELI